MKEVYQDILNHMETDQTNDRTSSYQVEYIKTSDGTKLPFIRPHLPSQNELQRNKGVVPNGLFSQA